MKYDACALQPPAGAKNERAAHAVNESRGEAVGLKNRAPLLIHLGFDARILRRSHNRDQVRQSAKPNKEPFPSLLQPGFQRTLPKERRSIPNRIGQKGEHALDMVVAGQRSHSPVEVRLQPRPTAFPRNLEPANFLHSILQVVDRGQLVKDATKVGVRVAVQLCRSSRDERDPGELWGPFPRAHKVPVAHPIPAMVSGLEGVGF
jgi:hypothetical protein